MYTFACVVRKGSLINTATRQGRDTRSLIPREDFIINRAADRRDITCIFSDVCVLTEQHNLIAHAYVGYLCNVNDTAIHTDSAYDRFLSPYGRSDLARKEPSTVRRHIPC